MNLNSKIMRFSILLTLITLLIAVMQINVFATNNVTEHYDDLIIPLDLDGNTPEREFNIETGRRIWYIYAWVDGSCKYIPVETEDVTPEIIVDGCVTPEYNLQLCTYTIGSDGIYTIKSLGYDLDDEGERYTGLSWDLSLLNTDDENVHVIVADEDVTMTKLSDSVYSFDGSNFGGNVAVNTDSRIFVLLYDEDEEAHKMVEYSGFHSSATFDTVTYVVANNPDSKTEENLLLMFATSSYKIEANEYTVSYDANGGENAPSSQTKPYNEALVLSSDIPTRENYTFEGWATNLKGSVVYLPGESYTNNSNITLYAVWTPENPAKYTDNILIPLQIYGNYPEREFNIETSERIWYIYAWVNGSCKYIPVETEDVTPEIIVDGCVTPEYNLQLCTFTIGSDGIYTIKSLGYDLDEDEEEYIGIGKDISVLDSDDENEQVIVIGDTDVTMNRLAGNRYSLEESSLGRNVDVNSDTRIILLSFDEYEDEFEIREFPGFTSPVFFDTVTYVVSNNPDSRTRENLTLLFATTTKNIAMNYKIIYNLNGGTTGPASQLKTHGETYTISTTIPTREDYTFVGWATSPDGKVEYKPGSTYSDNANLTLYAKWIRTDIDKVTINSINILDSSSNLLTALPSTSFVAEVDVTNNAQTGAFTVMISTFDSDGKLLDLRYLYANPKVGTSIKLGASISNASGKVAKIKAMVFDTANNFVPLTSDVVITK